MVTRRRTQQERRDETRTLVLEQACLLFGEKGYGQTSLQDIAKQCGLTIRPVYHYFGNKKALFIAVTEHMEQQLVEKMEEKINNPETQTIAGGWEAFMEMANDHHFRQIVLFDAPAILGRERWATSSVVAAARQILMASLPDINERRAELVTRMLIAALAEAAMILAENPGDSESADTVVDTLGKLLG